MNTDTMIRNLGMKALREKLGLIEAEKFIALIRKEPFDYTEWQKTLWEGQSVDDLFNAAQAFSEKKK
jgi:hypothetical protein